GAKVHRSLRRRRFSHGLSQDDPEDPVLLRCEVFPPVRLAAVQQRAVTALERLPVAVVVQRHRAVEHVEELHLTGLDDHALRRHALGARIERGHHRADLALEQTRAEHAPALGGAVEGDHGVVFLAAHLDATAGVPIEQRGDRHTERSGEPAEGVQRRRQASRLDRAPHAGGQARLLGDLALLQAALEPQRLDPRAERAHGSPPLSNDMGPASRPASRASARATYTRTSRLRYGCVKSVLSSGFAGPAAASAARVIVSDVSRSPTSAAAAAGASRGVDATAPRTMRAARTPSPSRRRATATPRTGKSNEPRRRSFRYTESQPSAAGSTSAVRISSRRLAR